MPDPKPESINTELIYYMFDEIKAELKDIKKEYVTKTESVALKQEIHELRKEMEALKARNGLKDTLLWMGLVASAIINVVVIYRLFTGE